MNKLEYNYEVMTIEELEKELYKVFEEFLEKEIVNSNVKCTCDQGSIKENVYIVNDEKRVSYTIGCPRHDKNIIETGPGGLELWNELMREEAKNYLKHE